MNPYSTELCHHGILGQRWGKRNGPPYPLDAEDHSASEKKAGWRKSVKSMSDEELRQKISRKRLENDYKYYSSKVGKSRELNDAFDITKKGLRTAGSAASAISRGLNLKNKSKVDNINDIDDKNITKKMKREMKKEIQKGETISNIVSQTSHNTANALQRQKRVSVDNADLSKMSDADLRKRVNRLMLEAQYEDAYNVNKGKERAEMILDTVGAVTSVATTAISLALLFKDLPKRAPKPMKVPTIKLV